MSSTSQSTTNAPKRSLFKKPAWAATDASSQKAGDFFRHAESIYREILAEKEKKRDRQHRKQGKDCGEIVGDHRMRDSKRRRVSEEEGDDDDDDDDRLDIDEEAFEKPAKPVTRRTPTNEGKYIGSPVRPSSVNAISPPRPSTPLRGITIDLGDDDSDTKNMPNSPPKLIPRSSKKAKPKVKPVISDPESEDEDEDEYTLDLKKRARETERLRKMGVVKPSTAGVEISKLPSLPSLAAEDQRLASTRSPAQPSFDQSLPPPSTKGKDDPIVQILIQTAIPDTKPLIVNRRATQSLQPVKAAWCQRQGFDAAMSSKVILTWRGKKLWNTSTCTYILKKLKEERPSRATDFDEDGSDDSRADPSKGRIEVEAITEEILEQRSRLRKHEELADAQIQEHNDVYGQTHDEETPTSKEPEIVIQLKSPGLETLLLKVRPSTEIKKIMAGCKKMMRVGEGKTCWLVFDGDRLEPENCIADTEIENDDVVEVTIR